MFGKSKVFWGLILIAVFLLASGWGMVFGLAERMVTVTPVSPRPLKEKMPRISLTFPYLPLQDLKKMKISLDGVDITSLVSKSPTGFTYQPPQPLADGKHQIRAEFDYALLASKPMNLYWSFSIDTMPPEILFAKYDSAIASPKFWLDDLAGQSEPRARLKLRLNTRELPEQQADENGNFKLAVYSLATRNNLTITAVDEAGNRSTRDVQVKVDLSSPLILDVSPAEGESVFGESATLTAQVDDGNSEVEEVNLFVNGNAVNAVYDPVQKHVAATISLTKDGVQKASLEIADAAGNSSRRDWSFNADTCHLVVDCSECKIYYYREGKLVKIYPCAVGTAGFPTPKGHWKVINKRKNPTWSNPGSAWAKSMPPYIPPGPGNPLGPRAIDLDASGIRLHGTPKLGSIGHPASHGCIRMYPKDVIELFEYVSVGTPVDIVP